MARRDFPDVCMIGLGYIGLPTAAVIARSGCHVTGVDVRQDVVDTINRGEIHIEEADLDRLVHQVVADGNLVASTTPATADVFIIAVPTPFKNDGHHTPDTSFVMAAADAVAEVCKAGDLVILESTSPVGTTEAVRDRIAERRPDLSLPQASGQPSDLAIAYCPERVLPGKIIAELEANDRSIGGITPSCAARASAFYRLFVRGECIETDARSAEMTKLVENSFRDVNIAFANELSMIADAMDLDVWEIIRLANRHPRVNILQPGPGVGGHCIAVDPWFIVHSAPDTARLIRTGREINDGKTCHVLARAKAMAEASDGGGIACLGLAFKANIDDFRESPALQIALELAREFGDRVRIVEPFCEELPKVFSDTKAQKSELDVALDACDVVLVLVDHDIFSEVSAADLEGKAVYDTRGLWSANDISGYSGIRK